MILPYLEKLTSRGWWTVGSQPAVDGASSSDEVVGWGPIEGYVYQKCFVEFFAEESDMDRIEQKVLTEGKDLVYIFAGNKQVSGFKWFLVLCILRQWRTQPSRATFGAMCPRT
jgi:methylenetetrahydrofolate reductase (NADPH)